MLRNFWFLTVATFAIFAGSMMLAAASEVTDEDFLDDSALVNDDGNADLQDISADKKKGKGKKKGGKKKGKGKKKSTSAAESVLDIESLNIGAFAVNFVPANEVNADDDDQDEINGQTEEIAAKKKGKKKGKKGAKKKGKKKASAEAVLVDAAERGLEYAGLNGNVPAALRRLDPALAGTRGRYLLA